MKLKYLPLLFLCGCIKTHTVKFEKAEEITLTTLDNQYASVGSTECFNNQLLSLRHDLSIDYFVVKNVRPMTDYKYDHTFKLNFALETANITYYLPLPKDTIIYCDSEHKNFYLFNHLGNPIDVWSIFRNKPDSFHAFIPMASKFYPIIYENDTLYSRICPWVGSPDEFKMPFEYGFFKHDSSVNYFPLPVRYPDIYRSGKSYNNLSTEFVSRCQNDKGEFVYSFPISHELFVYNKKELIKTVNCKSKYIEQFEVTPDDKTQDLQYTIKTYGTAPYYSKIYYDKYRHLYYRIAAHQMEHKKPDGTLNFSWRDKSWSIIILDNDLNVLSEYLIPPHEYVQDLVITPDGVLLQKLLKPTDSRLFSKFELNKIITL